MSTAKIVSVSIPKQGDLIDVEKSTWYAVRDGGRLMVCEPMLIMGMYPGEFCVVPRGQCNVFYGPSRGPATLTDADVMSTSGGPFKTLHVRDVELEYVGKTMNRFWCWQDYPRAGGGQTYEREVSLWRMRMLSDE